MFKKIVIILMIISIFALPSFAASVGDTVSVGGMPFGIKFYTDGVLVCGVSDVDTDKGNVSPGSLAGLKKGDIITKIDDTDIIYVNDILKLLKRCDGKALNICYQRESKRNSATITPVRSVSEDTFKLGLWLKDGTAGIGTVTYIEDNGNFAGLGHGVCDAESGALLKLREGQITNVTVTGIKPSSEGDPGHLQGIFTNETGTVSLNTVQGVFGKLQTLPDITTKAVVASAKETKEGPANILCTLDDNIICQYDIEIEKINHNDSDTKNFVIKVADKTLIGKTGGIVQGMSGSPIIQDGKLVGAVTHVLVDDPTRGYGIFIENMLKSES